MADIKLVVNGQDFPVNYELLRHIASRIPDTPPYTPLVKALLNLEIPSITAHLVGHEYLEVEDLDAVWEMGEPGLRRELARTSKFRCNLTDRQAEEIMEANDPAMLIPLAEWAEEFCETDDKKGKSRLAPKMAKKLLQFVASHPDREVQQALLENPFCPKKWRRPFREIISMGLEPDTETIAGFEAADLPLLPHLSLDVLQDLARYVEEINDGKMREKVVEFLCQHRDPAVRMSLAGNGNAPKDVLKKLSKDADGDVALEAASSLE